MYSTRCDIQVNASVQRVHETISETYAPGGLPRVGVRFDSEPPRRVLLSGGEGKELCTHEFVIVPQGAGATIQYTMSFPNMPESRQFGAWLGMTFSGKKAMKQQLQQFKAEAETP